MFGIGTVRATDLMEGLWDLHAHLLPGIDDGAITAAETAEVLRTLHGYGIRGMHFTPHIMAEVHAGNDARSIARHFREWSGTEAAETTSEGVRIRFAAEYMLDELFPGHMAGGLLTLGDRHVLVETRAGNTRNNFEKLVFDISAAGYTPILAHPERYISLSAADLAVLRERGCKMHLNILSLTGRYGKAVLALAREFLRAGMYDFLVTDIHGARHMPIFEQGRVSREDARLAEALKANNEALWKTKDLL